MEKIVGKANGITEGIIWQELIKFFLPILLGAFFQQLYNTVDAVIVGNFVGKSALAAVGGTTGTLINVLVGFFIGLSSGATVIISQYYGAKKVDETSKTVHTAMALAIVGGFIIMIIGFVFSKKALVLMGTPDDILGFALVYMNVYFAGIISTFIYNIGSSILRAVGDSKRPLYFLIISTFVNIVLDLLFVIVFKLGVLGAGLATIIAQTVSAILIIISLVKTDDIYKLYLKKIRITGFILRDIIRIGIPAGLQSIMYTSSNVIIQATLNVFGTNIIAAWTAYSKIDGIFWMAINAFGISITTFVGQNFGAKKYDRMRKCVKVCLLMAMATAILLSSTLLVFGGDILKLFTSDNDVIKEGIHIINTLVPFYFTYVCIEILSGAVRGVGDAVIPMIITCVGVCVLRVVWIYTVVPHYHNITTVVISYPVTWSITSFIFIIYYLKGTWFKKACSIKQP